MNSDRTDPDRTALRVLLRTHRSQLDPADYGFDHHADSGRRAAGLTQAQVDILTNRVSGTYQRLESGRRPNQSVAYLADIGHLYGLTETEWVALNRYTRRADPPHPLDAHAGLTVPAVWRHAVEGIECMAYVGNRRWDVLAHNAAFATMFPGCRVPANTMRWMLCDHSARDVLAEWDAQWAPEVVTKLRAARLAMPHDDVLAKLEADVLADPDSGPIYRRARDVRVHSDGIVRPLNHPEWGPGWVLMCSAMPLSSPRAQIMILPFRTEKPAAPRVPLRA